VVVVGRSPHRHGTGVVVVVGAVVVVVVVVVSPHVLASSSFIQALLATDHVCLQVPAHGRGVVVVVVGATVVIVVVVAGGRQNHLPNLSRHTIT
jgi:hypothetical protein